MIFVINWFFSFYCFAHNPLGGHIKLYPTHVEANSVSALLGSLRLNYDHEFNPDTTASLHFEFTPIVVAQNAGFGVGTPAEDYRIDDLNNPLSQNGDLTIRQNLDRLMFKTAFAKFDLTIGRQAIAFGSGRVANPTDVFLPYDLQSFNTEYRRGIDAIRFQYVLGLFSELDIGMVAKDNGFVRFRSQYSETDYAFISARFQDRDILGLSLQSSLMGNGVWFEAGQVFSNSQDDGYLRWNLGTDRLVSENSTISFELHFNGAGSEHQGRYGPLYSTFAYQSSSVFLLGQLYIAPAFSWQLSELNGFSHALFINLNDSSVLMVHGFESSLQNNQYLEAGASLGFGNDGSEFEMISNVYHMGWKLYF